MSQQQKRKKLVILAIVAAAPIAALVAITFAPTKTELTTLPPEDKEMGAAMDAAREFLVSSPTFSFDGVKESVDIVAPLESLKPTGSDIFQYNIKIAFDSAHAGYGNRQDQVLTQAITHHTADISVYDGKVISAIIDNTWDEIHQSNVTSESGSQLGITADKDQYLDGETITITITNTGNTRLFPVGWGYTIVGDNGQKYAPNGVLKMMLVALPPGESIHWTWDQLDENASQVSSGKYRIVGSYVGEGIEKEVTGSKEIEIIKRQSKLASSDEQVAPFEGMATDYVSLVNAIKSRGVAVQETGELSADSSTFGVPIKTISVGGADIQVYEFESESDAVASSLTVSEDGTQIGNSVIRWMDSPHFYTSGKLIVTYIGHNPELTSLLESFLGNQFAGM